MLSCKLSDEVLASRGASCCLVEEIARVVACCLCCFVCPGPTTWFVNDVLAPALKRDFDINVAMQPAVYSGCGLDGSSLAVVCQVRDQIANGEPGTVDLIWLNKANFKAMKQNGLLYGPWSTQLPSSANFDFSSSAIAYDAGVPVDGMEFPLHLAQAVFLKNKAFVTEEQTPTTIPLLLAWCQNNPGRFTYSDPTLDFTGAAFVRHLFAHFTTARGHTWERFLALPGTGTEALYLEVAADVWEALRDLEANLWSPGYYPTSHNTEIRPLVADTTLWLDFSFEAAEATNQQDDATNPWPITTDACVFFFFFFSSFCSWTARGRRAVACAWGTWGLGWVVVVERGCSLFRKATVVRLARRPAEVQGRSPPHKTCCLCSLFAGTC